MMNQKKKRPLIFAALARRIIALGLGLWLAFMVLITWSAAVDMQRQLRTSAWTYAATYSRSAGILPGGIESGSVQLTNDFYLSGQVDPIFPFMISKSYFEIDAEPDQQWKWLLGYGFEPAVILYDEYGQRLSRPGDYLLFFYCPWSPTELPPQGIGYLDLNSSENLREKLSGYISPNVTGMSSGIDSIFDLRMSGWFENGEFHPVTILQEEFDGTFDMLWSESVPPDKELVDIRTTTIRSYLSQHTPITANGTRFESLYDLLDAHCTTDVRYTSDSLWRSIIIYHFTRSDDYGKYQMAIAVRCYPIGFSALQLIPFYLITGAITGFAIFLLLRRIRKNLTEPLWVLRNAAITGAAITPRSDWFEIYRLEEDHVNSRQALSEANAETQRLRTALSYAKDAEKNRRELISGITHELKTPLAVIHGYAEGLQAGIAEDKKDRYLSVILEETEKMDATVLELLDLSRLEAGKVHLSMDTFSLLTLTQTVADKFIPLLEARNLTISYGVAEDFRITADESRIEQVITNLISNAVKYAPDGSCIYISVCLREKLRQAFFSIDNESPPLTDQQLEKVWDSFYRTDPSRSAPGTGLGLALVKRIIDLHQGKCLARNRKYISSENATTRVEFSFTLPLS